MKNEKVFLGVRRNLSKEIVQNNYNQIARIYQADAMKKALSGKESALPI